MASDRKTLPWTIAALVLLASGCGSDDPPAAETLVPDATDAGNDAGADAGIDAGLPLELPAGDDGHGDVGAALGAGEVRAGRITAAGQLLSGIKVEGKLGDFKLYNDHAAFIIAAARPTDGYAPFGGELLDASRVVDGEAEPSLIGETIISAGVGIVEAKTVGVINDGTDGQPALVRVIGETAAFPLVAGLVPGIDFRVKAHAVIDYVLAPDSAALEIRLRLFNKRLEKESVPISVLGLLSGDGVHFFTDKRGFDVDGALGTPAYLATVGDDVSYVLTGEDEGLTPLVMSSGIWIITAGSFELPGGGEAGRRYRLLVAGGTPERMQAAVRRDQGIAEPAGVSGTVRDTAGKPVAGARIHVRPAEDEGYVTMARSGPAGEYHLGLAAGDYRVQVVTEGGGRSAVVPLTVPAAGLAHDLELPTAATVRVRVVDQAGQEIPAKLSFTPAKPLPALPESYGERRLPGGAAEVLFHVGGEAEVKLAAGKYALVASRGFEYEIDSAALDLAPGSVEVIELELVRSVDTSGYLCGDFHLHAMWSPDSSDLYELKVSALAASGVELPVATDHEYIADYNPAINKLGLQKWLRGIVGEELTTVVYGHFNPFPITADPSATNRGAIRWWGLDPIELFGAVRAAWPDAVLQINHPRSQAISGYFTYVGYDPTTGTAKSASSWSTNFDAIEVFNGSGWQSNRDDTVVDWLSLLDQGLPMTATGNSDSHRAYSQEVGYPRNYVRLSTDEPANVDLSEFARAVRGQRVVVSGGAFIDASVGGKGLGELADASGGEVELAIRVQAPQWVPLDTLLVLSNGGKVIEERTLDASTADPQNPAVRFEGKLALSPSVDSWVVVVAYGKGTLAPVVIGKKPFAVTNPIYLDVDGNGRFDPPSSP